MADRPIKVLLIEDNPGDARLITEMLSEVDSTLFDVENAFRLSEGLTRIQKGGIDVVLLDLGLPDSSGIDTFEKVHDQTPEVPIVMLTGLDDTELALEGMSKGAQDYLVKGRADGDLLARTLRYAIERMAVEARIKHLNSVLKAIRNINQLIVTETERDSLFRKSCDALVDARGYDAAWLGSLEDGERFATVVGSGFPDDVSRFSKHVTSGDHPPCIRDALREGERVLVLDKSRKCGDCFFKDACLGKEAAIIRVEHAGRLFGLLAVLLASGVTIDDEEKGLLVEVASDIGIALHNEEIADARKVAEDALLESEEKYRTIYNNTQVGLYRSRLRDGKMLMVNNRMAEIFGYDSPENAVADYVASEHYVDPGTREELLDIIREHGKFTNFESRVTRLDGSVVWIQYSGALVPGKGYFEGVATDITEQKAAEDALLKSEEQFRMMFENMGNAVAVYEAVDCGNDFIIKDFNRAAEKIECVQRDDLIGKSLLEAFPGVVDFGLFDVLQRVWQTGEPGRLPASFYKGAMNAGWRENYVYKLPSGEIVAIYEDVTERKAAENALLESEGRLQLIAENMPVMLDAFDDKGNIIVWNSECEKVTGFNSMEIINNPKAGKMLYPDKDYENHIHSMLVEYGSNFRNLEWDITCKDGSTRTILWSNLSEKYPIPGWYSWAVGTDITERKVAEERLRAAEERFRTIVETAPSVLLISDADGSTRYVSPNCEEFTGYDPDELTCGVLQWVHKDDAKRAKDIFERTFSREVGCKDFEYKAVKKNGDTWYASTSWEPLMDAKGTFKGAVFQTVDVTGRKAAEGALLESEGKYRSLMDDVLDTSEVGIFILDCEFKVVWINRSTEKYFGLKREDVLGKDKRQLIHKITDIFEDPETFKQKVVATYDNNTYIENFECHVLPGEDRKEYWLRHWSQPIRSGLYKGGRIEHYSDITERKAAADALKESEGRYRALFETAKDAIFLSDETGKFMDVNSAACGLLGYSKEGLLKMGSQEIDADPRGYEAFLKVRNGMIKEAVFEVNQQRKDGTLVPVEISGKSFEVGDRKLFLAIARDITERKAAADALKESESRYKHLYSMVRLMCDNLPDLMWTKDMEGNFIFVNEACCDILLNAIDTDEPIGKDDMYFARRERKAHPENPDYHTFGEPCMSSDLSVMKTKEPQRFDEFGNLRGEFVYFDVYKAPFWSEEHNLIGIVGCSRVVTKERQTEEQIKRSLQEKEVLLREIHHRVKNNLQVVSSLLNMQARNVGDKETIEVLSEARDRIKTMSLIHSQLYESRDLAEVNMKGFVDVLLGQLLQSYPVGDARIVSVIRVADRPFPISIAVPVGLIINELLSNALKHAFDGRDHGTIEVRLSASEEGRIHLTICDDGVGLPPGFDISKSKTLGLHLVKILSEDQLQGTLEVTSDGGATFRIEFEMGTE
ncbi:MAG: Methyl sulfide methyltransferase-associated sensor [Candidatus Methanogaster sp.]|nr:MAG: Methyl sulfide methyltransferase-associated sensor [ANME-2 cluster archaeon]